jgi:hypothetical protein
MEEIIDIEEYSKAGKVPEKGKKYRFRVDKTVLVSDKECLTGKEILEKAGLNPAEFLLRQLLKGNNRAPVENEQTVCFTTPGIERFVTIPKDPRDGSGKREFSLFPQDLEFLERLGCPWQAVIDGGNNWLIISDFPIPDGYNSGRVELAVLIPNGYPRVPLDMGYFHPPVKRLDSLPIPATESMQSISGRAFQRWSRHRGNVAWREDVDNLATHILEIEYWLKNEFVKRPSANAKAA